MRKRKDIEEEFSEKSALKDLTEILEVLLDIRDLLKKR